jgi:hypothetical protein
MREVEVLGLGLMLGAVFSPRSGLGVGGKYGSVDED